MSPEIGKNVIVAVFNTRSSILFFIQSRLVFMGVYHDNWHPRDYIEANYRYKWNWSNFLVFSNACYSCNMRFCCYGKLNENEVGLDEHNLGQHVFSRLHLRMKMTSAEWNVISFKTITFLTAHKNNYKIISIYNSTRKRSKNSLRKLFQFSFYPFSLQICTKVIFLKDLETGANFDFSKVRLMKICR